MKKGLFVFLFVCNLFTLGAISASDIQFGHSRSSFNIFSGLLTFLPFIIIGVTLLIIIFVIVNSINRGGVLILKDFFFKEVEYEYLKIIGRPTGFISWLKSLFGKDSVTNFICNRQEIKFENSGMEYSIPLRHVTCVAIGKNKSIFLLILGIIFIILGISCVRIHVSIVFFGLILGIILIILFTTDKKIYLKIYTVENKPFISISLKGQNIFFDKFISAYNFLRKNVLGIGTPIRVIK